MSSSLTALGVNVSGDQVAGNEPTQFRGEYEAVLPPGVVQRLDAQRVPGQNKPPRGLADRAAHRDGVRQRPFPGLGLLVGGGRHREDTLQGAVAAALGVGLSGRNACADIIYVSNYDDNTIKRFTPDGVSSVFAGVSGTTTQ